ncbi:MAG: hypothetical protein WEF86_01860 [Gemmatimonadota bacterium]
MKTNALMLLAITAAACADEMPRDVREATAPAADTGAPAPDTVTDPFTVPVVPLPPGGYVSWISDIRETLPSILEQAEQDRGEAQDALQQLYLARQQPLREQFGKGGEAATGDEMDAAIERVEEHFDELMRQLAEVAVPAERLEETAAELQLALTDVETAGTAAGLPPEAPRR